MKIISMNLNKRLHTLTKRSDFIAWINDQSPDIICLQEVCKRSVFTPKGFSQYEWIEGNNNTSIYVHDSFTYKSTKATKDFSFLYLTDATCIVSVYFSAYKSAQRVKQLEELSYQLSELAATEEIDNVIVVGDFNLAPRPIDGLVNSGFSKFTSHQERATFASFLRHHKLMDLGIDAGFTIERAYQRRYHTQFRVDLALVRAKKRVSATWDHRVREKNLFTDHSAIILEVRD